MRVTTTNVGHDAPPPIPQTISGPPPSQQLQPDRQRSHRRANSDDPGMPGVPTGGSPRGVAQGSPRTAQPQFYQHPNPSMQRSPDGSYSPQMNAYPPLPTIQQHQQLQRDQMMNAQHHQQQLEPRGRSWSISGATYADASQMSSTPPQSIPRGMAANHLANERQALAKKTRRRDRHRRASSSSAAMPGPTGYGAFWNGGATTAAASHQRSPSFTSARGEMMSLTAGFRDPSELSPCMPPQSPRMPPQSPRMPPQSPRMPHQSPTQHRKATLNAHGDMQVTWSPATPGSQRGSIYDGSVGGGEPVYFTQKRSKSESSRKMQLRQHSAQFFMEEIKGTEQPASCRDVVFLLLFVFHLIFMIYLGQIYGKEALKANGLTDAEYSVTIYYSSFIYLSAISGAFAVVISASLLAVMIYFARYFVQVALIFVITISFIWGTLGIGLSPQNLVPITGIIALALSVAYAFIVWERIPFSAANLLTALDGVHAFPGTIGVAFIFQALALGWSVYYAIIIVGIYDAIKEGKLELSHRMVVVVYVLLGISYYWTNQVFSNSVQAATAAVIGRWWSAPEGEGVVRHSAVKTIFYSMGSICFGSLFVGPVSIIRLFSVLLRPNNEVTSLMCVYECVHCIQGCVTSCVDNLADRFNQWAFTYVGLYGYGFLDAGLHATNVFEKRGWSTIVSDDLVPNILLVASLVIGGVTGCFAYIMQSVDLIHALSLNDPGLSSFWIGTCVGFVVTSVLFSVISSAMNTVLVCFATSPVDFEINHAELSHEMRAAWREVWPGALDVIDLHDAMNASPTRHDGIHPLI